jgi:hypothetical protein
MTEDGRECLDEHKGECSGEVLYHPSIAGTGTMIPRCDKHYKQLLDWHENYSRDMPDSLIAPSWFDPTVAGEHWGDDY